MKILQIFGAVVAVHLLAFIFIFASPGCSSSPKNVPTPDATLPGAAGSSSASSYSPGPSEPLSQPVYAPEGTPGRVSPTRPGSPNAAAITPTRSAANVAPVSKYTVQRGDSLWTIAKKHHIAVTELTKANNLSSNAALHAGQNIMIPGQPVTTAPAESAPVFSAPKVSAPAETTVRTSNEVTHHVVASGESVGTIARKYQVSVGELVKANNITDPAKIRVGQQLTIPGGKTSSAKRSSTPAAKPAASAPAAKPAPAPAAPVVEPPPAPPAPTFEIKAPPPGQALDAGLPENSSTDVPTIKVEEPKSE